MARARSIKPSLFKNEILGEADPLLTILFEGLWCLADREGRLEDRPKRIKAEIFPYREIPSFNGYLTDLERLGFIARYEVENTPIIQVINFAKHQSPHKTEKPSELPPPPAESRSCPVTVKAPLDNGADHVKESPLTDSLLLTPLKKKAPTKKVRQELPDIPEWLDVTAWDRWCKHRAEIRKPIKPSQAKAQFAVLDGYRNEGHDPVAVIDHSVAGGYQGLFPPDKRRANGTNTGFETAHDRIKRLNGGEEADPFAPTTRGVTVEGDGAVVAEIGRSVRR